MITTDSPIWGEGGGSIAEALAYLETSTSIEQEYIKELWRLCEWVSFDFRILFAQWALETDSGQSHWWLTRRNPAGIGVTGDPQQNAESHTWKNGIEAAIAQVVHMCAYTGESYVGQTDQGNEEIPNDYIMTDPRYSAVFSAGFDGKVEKLGDLGNGKWATDPNYATKIAAKANQIFKSGGSTMPIVATECPVEIAVVWDGPNRPGLPMNSPSKIVIHEVGNKSPGANEEMHKRFVHNGGGPFKVSFHFVVGPDEIIQLLNLDENAWHASDGFTGDGNRDAWGIEHIQIGDFDKTLNHSAWLQAELIRNPRRFAIKNPASFVPDITPAHARNRIVRHFDEAPDKKRCPEMMMNRGLFEPLKNAVMVELAGAPTPPVFAPKKPIPKPLKTKKIGDKLFIRTTGSLTLARDTAPVQFATPTALPVGEAYEAARKVTVEYITVGDDGEFWFVDKTGGRWPLSAFADVA